MKRAAAPLPDPDDMFADTRMSFGEHIEDLRTHLLRAFWGFLIAFVIAIPLGTPVLRFIASPVEKALDEFYDRFNAAQSDKIQAELLSGKYANVRPLHTRLQVDGEDLAAQLAPLLGLAPRADPDKAAGMMRGIESLLEQLQIDNLIDRKHRSGSKYLSIEAKILDPVGLSDALEKWKKVVRPSRLATFSIQEAFFVLFKVILMAGFVLASPWVFYQIWSFIAAGLYPNEKRLVNVYGPFSIVLFLIGVFICELFVIPKAIEAMLWFNELLGFQPDLRLSEWLGFAIFMPLVFGLSFQTPLVMMFMEKIGVATVDTYRGKRRMAWFVMAIFAALITPSTDAFSMLFLWVPMSLLYELGIWLCALSPRRSEPDWETSESEELIEV